MSLTSTSAVFSKIAHARRSCRRFLPNRQVPPTVLRNVLESTLRTPSSFNLQPTQIIMVQDQSVKQHLARDAMVGAGNQYRVQDCAALAVFLSDLQPDERIPRVAALNNDNNNDDNSDDKYFSIVTSFLVGTGHLSTVIKQSATRFASEVTQSPMPTIYDPAVWSVKNTALSAQSFLLACTSHDLATCIMEGLDERRMQRILRVPPERYTIPFVVAVGYDYHNNDNDSSVTPRLPVEELVFSDTFGAPYVDEDDDDDDDEGDDVANAQQ